MGFSRANDGSGYGVRRLAFLPISVESRQDSCSDTLYISLSFTLSAGLWMFERCWNRDG